MTAENLQLADHHCQVGHQDGDDDGDETAQEDLEDKGDCRRISEQRIPHLIKNIKDLIPGNIAYKENRDEESQDKGQSADDAAGNGPKHSSQ